MKKILFILLLCPLVAHSQYTDTIYKKDHILYYFIWNEVYPDKKSKQEGYHRVYKDKIISQWYDNKRPIFPRPDTLLLSLDSMFLENDTLRYKVKGKIASYHPYNKVNQQNMHWTYLCDWVINASKIKFPEYYNKYLGDKP